MSTCKECQHFADDGGAYICTCIEDDPVEIHANSEACEDFEEKEAVNG